MFLPHVDLVALAKRSTTTKAFNGGDASKVTALVVVGIVR